MPSDFADGPQLFARDPGRRGFHAISGLQDIGKLVDLVLRREIMARCVQTR